MPRDPDPVVNPPACLKTWTVLADCNCSGSRAGYDGPSPVTINFGTSSVQGCFYQSGSTTPNLILCYPGTPPANGTTITITCNPPSSLANGKLPQYSGTLIGTGGDYVFCEKTSTEVDPPPV